MLAVALDHHAAGRFEQAAASYRAVLDVTPANADALRLLGTLALQQQQLDEALRWLHQAVAAAPDSANCFKNLGNAYVAKGWNREALVAYQKAVTLAPHQPDHQNLLELVQERLAHGQAQRLGRYRQMIEDMAETPYLAYPCHVHMETLALCNAACKFCPYPTIDRQGARMSDALIERIITDLTDVPRSVPFQLSPFKVNEPFLETRLFDILAMINDKLPQAEITLTSNATPLTEAKLQQLAKVKQLRYLWISLNDHRPDHYQTTMQLNFARTRERLDLLHRHKASGDLRTAVIISRVGDDTAVDHEFAQWVRASYPLFEPVVVSPGGWIGQVDMATGAAPDVKCARWFELSITATGTVAHCCMDGKAAHPIGDVSRQHVLDVYNDPAYRRLREKALSRRDVAPCNGCTFL